jgi:HK97 family phage portal protein
MASLLKRIGSAANAFMGRDAKVPLPSSGYSRGYSGAGLRVPPLLPSAKFQYANEAGDLFRNVTTAVCLGWISDQFGQAKIQVCDPGVDGAQAIAIPDHPLTLLLDNPNPFMSAEELWSAMILSDKTDGNTYLLKAKGSGGYGEPMNLWWVPPGMMGPWSDPETENFIDKYWYQPGNGGTYWVPVDQVVHVKSGIDPYDTRIGCARLKHALRSIVTVNRADSYIAAIIANGGPIRVFVPDGAEYVDEATAEGIRNKMERANSGENVGRIEILSAPGTFQAVGSGPGEMALGELLDRPEANICALLGVNAMVTGLAVGNNTRTYSNLKEAESEAWTNGIIPTQKRFAKAFQKSLLPDFPGSEGKIVEWDWSKVVALSEDASEKITRASAAFTSKLLPRDRCLAIAGEKPVGGEEGELYFDQATQAEMDSAMAHATLMGGQLNQPQDQPEPNAETPDEDTADDLPEEPADAPESSGD